LADDGLHTLKLKKKASFDMDLLAETRSVLEKADYSVYKPSIRDSILYFEDRTVLGFVWVASSSRQLFQGWQTEQDSFLKSSAKRIAAAPSKAWNIYSVFLTDDNADSETQQKISAIQEDFRSTRKIAQSGLVIPQDVVNALLPLLPIQNVITERGLSREMMRSKLAEAVGGQTITGLERIAAAGDRKVREMAITDVAALFLRRK
jgi:hypothetical protein